MPVATISFVCASRSMRKVESSWQILFSEPESFVSSPRLFGVTARPTMGEGKGIGGRVNSPSDMPVRRSSSLMTAAMPPGPTSSIGWVSLACTAKSWPSFSPLRSPETCTVSSFLIVPE